MLTIAFGIILAIIILANLREILGFFFVIIVFLIIVGTIIYFPDLIYIILIFAIPFLLYTTVLHKLIFKKQIELKKLFVTFDIENKLSKILIEKNKLLLNGVNESVDNITKSYIRSNNIKMDEYSFVIKEYVFGDNSHLTIKVWYSNKEICYKGPKVFQFSKKITDIDINNLSNELDKFINYNLDNYDTKLNIPKNEDKTIYDDFIRYELNKKYVYITFNLIEEDGITVTKPQIIKIPTLFKFSINSSYNDFSDVTIYDEKYNSLAKINIRKWEYLRQKNKIYFEN